MSENIEGKAVVITGASNGLGERQVIGIFLGVTAVVRGTVVGVERRILPKARRQLMEHSSKWRLKRARKRERLS